VNTAPEVSLHLQIKYLFQGSALDKLENFSLKKSKNKVAGVKEKNLKL
jgi:hypothetical protein